MEALLAIHEVPIGSCYNARDGGLRALVVACDGPHQFESIGHLVLTEGPEAPWHGRQAMTERVASFCRPLFESYVGIDYELSELTYWFFAPNAGSWDDGDRFVDCAIGNAGQTMQPPGSAKDSRR
jgi:hypothetical protein